ncbi:MAG TPA: metalloregulator ArsR/SmtB family transcription factor [Polyangiaceae bacterium]|nr:metalloregulator ArsR/SmtB family transcription factor [Polyangiaceae bacterium]
MPGNSRLGISKSGNSKPGNRRRAEPARWNAQRGTPQRALVFSALGDETRLALVMRLAQGRPASIAHLTHGSRLTRQAITKHLRVLKSAGLVRSVRAGRENLFALDPRPFKDMEEYLSFVSRAWDQALARLRAFVEE